MKFLDNKSFDELDTFQCHLLQSLKITSYSAPFLNLKRKNRVLLLPVIQNFVAPSKKINVIFSLLELRNLFKKKELCLAIFDSLREILDVRFAEEQRPYTRFHGSIHVFLTQ